MTAWSNWSGSAKAAPGQILEPLDEGALAAAIRQCSEPVRVVGAGHSFTPLGETGGTLITLDRVEGLVSADAVGLQATVRAGTRIHALGRPFWDAGLALKNQGDIDRQSVAGAVGTGTHGTGPTLGSLSSEVKGFRLVTAAGEVLECSPSSSADVWQAGRVSFGSLGVMSEITLAVRKAYKLRETNWVMPTGDCWRDLSTLRDKHRHFEFFWFPAADGVVAKSLDESDDEVADVLRSEQMKARGERVTADQRTFKLGCRLARVVPAVSPPLQRLFTRAAMGARSRVRWSHEIFPSSRTVRFNEMEYAVPAANGADCIREIAEVIRKRRIAGVFPLEFRFVKSDDVWLSPFYKRDAVTISVHQYFGQDYRELFDAAEAIFRRYGGRPHWGKIHSLRSADLERLYPRWGDFSALRRRLDPRGRLLNTYLKELLGV